MERKRSFREFAGSMLLFFLLLFAVSFTAQAADGDQYTLYVEGTYYYAKAAEMLPLINAERNAEGAGDLTLDQNLTEIAMQRAAESAVVFSHTRPDGTSWYTLFSSYYARSCGENLAAGNSTVAATFQQWMNSEGHKENMMKSSYQSIGIGCFRQGNVWFWAQAFSSSTASEGEIPDNRDVKVSVTILGNSKELTFTVDGKSAGSSQSIESGSSLLLTASRVNSGWTRFFCAFSADSFNWSSSNTSVATVDSDGRVYAHSAGTSVITASPKTGNGKASPASVTVNVTIPIGNTTIEDLPSVTYTGSAYTPLPVITYNGKTLTQGTDYTLSYSDNTNAGTASVTITGKGDYTGSATKTFRIAPAAFSASLGTTSFVYTGKAQTPAVTVKFGGSVLQAGTDYTLKYSNNKLPGYGTVTVTGKGNFSGTVKKLTFKIMPKKATLSSVKSLKKKKVTAVWKAVSGITVYHIQISTDKTFSTGVTGKLVSSKYTKYTYSGLKSGKTYYVRVRACRKVSGVWFCGSWSTVKSVKVK